MTIPIKISLNVKDFSLPYQRLDVWVTEAIKVSDQTKQQLNLNDFSFSRSRIKTLIEGNHLKVDGIIIDNSNFITNTNRTYPFT
jgi:RNA-binding protein YlmH